MTEKNAIDILKSLVGFDTTSSKSNLDLIEFIESYLNNHKIKSTLVYDSSGKKANLFATIGSGNEGGKMLSGHTDIVPIPGQTWTVDPFHLTQKKNKLYGRGTADMKGFLALILSRVPKMISTNLSKPIHLAFSYDEEVGCVGVHQLLDLINGNSIKPAFCIVGEPTSMEVVTGHKGKCAYQVVVRGLGCHSGQAPFGVNAVNYAAKLISHITEIAKEKSIKGPFDYDYEVPYTTLHTGVISGGTILNIVPDICQFEFEIRHLIEDNPRELINKIKLYAKEHLVPDMHKVSSKTDVHFEEKVTYPALSIDENSELVRYIKKLLNNKKHKKAIFGSEGGMFQEKLNLPTVVCGPGSIDQAHKADEYISIDQLEKGGKFLDDLITSK